LSVMAGRCSVIRRLREISWRDRLLAFEAMATLIMASVAIVILSFRSVGYLAALPAKNGELSPEDRALIIKRVRWAVSACARRSPLRAMCFEQGLTAQRMLRRRGVPSVLYFGAVPDDQKGLIAHVWVRDENVDVIGCETAAQYAVLAAFPEQAQNTDPKTAASLSIDGP